MPQSRKVLSVEVDQQSRKMCKIRLIGLGRQGFGQRNFSFGEQDVRKAGIELLHRLLLDPGLETDDKFFSHIPQAVIASVKEMDLLNRFIKGLHSFKKILIRFVDIAI